MKRVAAVAFFATIFTVAGTAAAFPEMVRHGYVNCTACHVSPNGGGVLNPYGRQLSKEVLSTWGRDGEEAFLYGLVRPPEWLALGGDVRMIQTYLNSTRVEMAKFIFMQADVEAAASFGRFTADATLGIQSNATFNKAGGTIFSRRHWLQYRPTDTTSLRAGRFMAAYGINVADHTVMTKRGLRWDEGSETYNLEAAYLGDRVDAFVTGVFGRPESPALDFEKGVALRTSVALKDTYKLGVSYFHGSNNVGNRHVFGPYAILGITPHFFILAELDLQRSSNATGAAWGVYNYLRVNYELLQGLHVYLTQELGKSNWHVANSTIETYGIGTQWFPRPHLELQASFQKQRVRAMSSTFSDFVWVMLHYYL